MKTTVCAVLVSSVLLGASTPEAMPVLPVKDLQKTMAFWKEKLGIELTKGKETAIPAAVTAGTQEAGATSLVAVTDTKGDVKVNLLFALGGAKQKASATRVFLSLPEVATIRSAFPDAPSCMIDGVLLLFVTDPDGNRICASGPLAKPIELFNGKDLTGWETFRKGSWTVEEGILAAEQSENSGGGWLLTDKQYGDFTVSLSFRLSRGANSGICIRYPGDGSAPPKTGLEIQFCEVDPDFQTGSIFGEKVAPRGIYRSGWNTAKVVVKGNLVVSHLNGQEVARATVDRLKPTGHLALQMHGGPKYSGTDAEFKDIVLTEE